MNSKLPKLDTTEALLEWAESVLDKRKSVLEDRRTAAYIAECVRLEQQTIGPGSESEAFWRRHYENERLRQAFETLENSRWRNHPTTMTALRGAMKGGDK